METQKRSPLFAFIRYFSKIIRQMKETNEGKFLKETDFLDTRSYFLPAMKTRVCHSHVPYSHLNTAIDQ